MKRILSGALLLCTMIFLFSSCKKTNDNASHIPKDATAVFSVDMGSIGKKLAWEVFFGSDIFKKMSKSAGKDSSNLKDIQNAGVDLLGTFYSYVSSDKRFGGGQHFAMLIPINDKGKWEAYVKKTWPKAKLKAADKRTEGLLDENLYAGWDDNMAIVMNTISKEMEMSADGNYIPPVTDEMQTAAEMENSFKMTKANSVADNKQFATLAKEGHDISIWVNYENIMNNYGTGMMGGFTPSAGMLKDAIFTTGLDFEKGAIKGDMKYYVSNELKAITKDLMNGKPDNDMLKRLPANNLDVLAAMNLSPKALKEMLDKFGLLGLVNVGLAEQQLTADDIFDAFTGDIGFSMNNFKIVPKKYGYTYYDDNMQMKTDSTTTYDPEMDWLYVMKINKQDKFDKLMGLATTMGGLQSTGNGTYKAQGESGPTIIVKDKFLIVSSSGPAAEAYIAGTNKGQKLHEVADKHAYAHPMTMFCDIKQMFAAVGTETMNDKKDAAQFEEVKKLLDNAVLSGGEFKDDAFRYELSINFNNKEESSLMQLIQFANNMAEIEQKQKEPVAVAVH